jgi:sulfatase modifying factor 1
MADVVISYKREDKPIVDRIAAQLRAIGLAVWYDTDLPPNVQYANHIAKQIDLSKSVLVCWSEKAVASEWVRAEADLARNQEKLISCQLNPCRIPLPFNSYHIEDLQKWEGRAEFPAWRKIVAAVAEKIGRPGVAALLDASGDKDALYLTATKYPDEPAAQRVLTDYEKNCRERFSKKKTNIEKLARRREGELHKKHQEALKGFEKEFEAWLERKRHGDTSPMPCFIAPEVGIDLEELADVSTKVLTLQNALEAEHASTAMLTERLKEADREFVQELQKAGERAETAFERAKSVEAELQNAREQHAHLVEEHENLKAHVAARAPSPWKRVSYLVGSIAAVAVFFGAGIFAGYRPPSHADAGQLPEDRSVRIMSTKNLRIYSESPKAQADCTECPKMIVVQGGTIPLGKRPGEIFDPNLERRIATAKPVDVKSFAISDTKITLRQYQVFAAEEHRIHDGVCRKWDRSVGRFLESPDATYSAPFEGPQNPDQPVVCVTWADASAYADWLSKKSGQAYRLPTEAQWEFAAREGSSDAWIFPANACSLGNIADLKFAAAFEPNLNKGGLDEPYMDCEDGALYVVPDRSYPPNKLGLFAMLGNAREWVQDCWHEASVDKPAFCTAETMRVQRGSGWNAPATAIHPAIRWPIAPTHRLDFVGFRVVKELS